MKKAMLVIGARPEAIKMCPLVNELKTRPNMQTNVCVSGQHRQMLSQVLEIWHCDELRPVYYEGQADAVRRNDKYIGTHQIGAERSKTQCGIRSW
jgi:UDP-N-acetylglucosamine 2-epimerase